MQRPRLKEKYRVEPIGQECTFLLSEREDFVLEGSDLLQVLPLVDGHHTPAEIVQGSSLPSDRVYAALELLSREGHLSEEDEAAPRSAAAFWSEFNVGTREVAQRLAAALVEVSAFGVDASMLMTQLAAAGIKTVRANGSADADATAHIAVVDDYGHPMLEALNARCLRERKPLLLVKPVGVRIWIGPLIKPWETACWQCMKTRLSANREIENFIASRTGNPAPFPSTRSRSRIGEAQAYSMAAVQIARWLGTGSNPNLESRMLVADLVTFDFNFHHVTRLPDCVACGDPERGSRAGQPIELKGLTAREQAGAGLRSEAPETTFARLQHHISPFSGIVSHVEKGMWHGIGPIRTYVAGHNFALKSNDLWFLKDGLRTHSSGKGWSDAQARTSALCEAIERHSGVFRGSEPRLVNSLKRLGEAAVDPRAAMLFSDTQYRDREKWLARRSRFQVVPEPFDEDAAISWTPLWSLTGRRPRLMPTSYLFYNFARAGEPFFCWADSNGAAAGRTLEEAMLQGLFELVERDAVCLWWYNRLRMPGVDLQSFKDPRIAQMQEFFHSLGRDLWVLNLTSDLNIPAFVALSRRRGGPTEDIMMGFGAHVDMRIAVTRALTELNQFIPALLNIAQDGRTLYALGDREAVDWWTTATIENQPYLLPRPGEAQSAADLEANAGSPGGDVLQHVISRLEQEGLEVLALDQTRPGVDLAVVKMVVPGLRHFWARFAPGRLYDVPVRLGLLPAALEETALNPVSMFL